MSALDNSTQNCENFQYDTGIWLNTIIEEWGLVCGRSWMISMTQALYMSGFILSYPIFGYLSDRFGRWRSLLIGGLIEVISGFGCAFADSISAFMVFRFLVGLGNAGRTSSSYLVMIEWTGPKWRMHISTLGSLGWVLGYCIMPWICLYFLHFRHMQLFVCFYEIVFIIWLLRIPESPRWLLTHKKFKEAYEVLLNAAKFNGLIIEETRSLVDKPKCRAQLEAKKVGNSLASIAQFEDKELGKSKQASGNISLEPYTLEEFDSKFECLVETIEAKEFTKNEDKLTVIDLFRWKNLRKYLLILFFVWATNSFVYYGIVLGVGNFGGNNLFVSFTIAGLTEFPSMFFTIVCMKFLPRRTTNLIVYLLTGFLCAIQLPLKYYNYPTLQQTSIMLAKLSNSCAFTCILYQTMELFPTSIRQTAYSSCSMVGRFGSILAPFVKELQALTNDSVAPVLYAVLNFFTAGLILLLPETKGSDLHDTLIEAERFKGTDKDKNAELGPAKAIKSANPTISNN